MTKFKIGDKCQPIKKTGCNADVSEYIIITAISGEDNRGGRYHYDGYITKSDGSTEKNSSCEFCYRDDNLELLKSSNSIMKTISEKFSLLFKSEPEKSFIKAGITTDSDKLTNDGQAIFLSWLLKKNGADFKKEVVDELLKEESK